MPLDRGNRSAAVFSKPFDVNSVVTHADKRVARAIGLSRSDLHASEDSIPNTRAPCVEVKRVAFLIQKHIICSRLYEGASSASVLRRLIQKLDCSITAGCLRRAFLVDVSAFADRDESGSQINVAPF